MQSMVEGHAQLILAFAVGKPCTYPSTPDFVGGPPPRSGEVPEKRTITLPFARPSAQSPPG
jgi:hypothetical protein